MASGVTPTETELTTLGGSSFRSITAIVLASPAIPALATTATSPVDATSTPEGRSPVAISRWVGSTLVPSTESTTTRLSLSRVSSARLPSGVNTMWLGPSRGSDRHLPAAATVVPVMVNTDTVPSDLLATKASDPDLLIDTPAAPLPAGSVAMTLGTAAAPFGPAPTAVFSRATRLGFKGDRSMTVNFSSGICLVGSAGSICAALVIARFLLWAIRRHW